MAKRRSSGISSKSFFTLVVLSVSALGLMAVTYASLQPTRSRSDASGSQSGCGRNPALSEIRSEGNPNSVDYTMRIINRDDLNSNSTDDNCKNDTYKITFNLPGNNWSANVLNNTNDTVTLREGKSETFKVRIKPPSGANNGRYNVTVRAVNARERKDGTRARDTEVIGYRVTGNGSSHGRTNPPGIDDNDGYVNCNRNPEITILRTPLFNDDGYVPNWAHEYRSYIKVKNNCGSTQGYKVNVVTSEANKAEWWIVGKDKEEAANIKLGANEERNMQVTIFAPKTNTNFWISTKVTGKYPNADLYDVDNAKIQSSVSEY